MSATTAPARSAACALNHRRTERYTKPTVATPSSACGASMLHECSPKIRAEISIGHKNAGGLSTVMKLEESDDPKSIAFQLFVPAWTAAE